MCLTLDLFQKWLRHLREANTFAKVVTPFAGDVGKHQFPLKPLLRKKKRKTPINPKYSKVQFEYA
jgi:hypothetical protein